MSPDDLPPLSTDVVVPDDARALARDVEAYRRELRAARRSTRLRRFKRLPRGRSGIWVVAAIVLVIAAGTAVALFGPTYGRRGQAPPAEPLASPALPVGQVGGLLPDVTLEPAGANRTGGVTHARDERPAVFVLVPPGCTCSTTMSAVLRTVQSHSFDAYVVGTPDDASLPDLAEPDATGSAGVALIDRTSELAAVYGITADAPTAVIVDGAGVVRAVVRGVTGADQVRGALDQLVRLVG
jgi:hypothetical protein